LDLRAALDECIGFELLAQEAEAQGMASHPDAVDAQKREAVRRLITADFEANRDSWEDVPMQIVREVWKDPTARSKYDHPEYRWCVYARAPLDRKADPASPGAVAAEASARRIHRALAGRALTMAEFFELVEANRGEDAIQVLRQPYNTPRKGLAGENFARALFEIPAVGNVSNPTRTRWGWDIILLTRITEERHSRLEDVADDIRRRVFPAWRARAFLQWTAELSEGHEIRVEDDWTERLPPDPLTLR
jgi:hypothetical protein